MPDTTHTVTKEVVVRDEFNVRFDDFSRGGELLPVASYPTYEEAYAAGVEILATRPSAVAFNIQKLTRRVDVKEGN